MPQKEASKIAAKKQSNTVRLHFAKAVQFGRAAGLVSKLSIPEAGQRRRSDGPSFGKGVRPSENATKSPQNVASAATAPNMADAPEIKN